MMKQAFIGVLSLALIAGTGVFTGCGGGGGGGGGTTVPSKLYVGEIKDAVTSNEIGGVGVDDLGNAIAGIQTTPGSTTVSSVLMALADGTAFSFTVSNGAVEPAGYPTLLTAAQGTFAFSNWNVAAGTVDITVTDGVTTETYTGVDASSYMPIASVSAMASASSMPSITKSTGTGTVLYYAYQIARIGLCPASLAISAGTLGWGTALAVGGCAVAATSIWSLFTGDQPAVTAAAQPVTDAGNCAAVQANTATAAQVENCLFGTAASAEGVGVYLDPDGTQHSGGGGAGTIAGSCNLTGTGSCLNYTGDAYSASSTETGCDAVPGGVYSISACTATGAVGVCTLSGGTVSEYQAVVYSPAFSAASGAAYCTSEGGTWSGTYTPPS